MQISAASLLAAQQTRATTPAQPRAPQSAQAKAAQDALFEPLLFGEKDNAAAPTTAAASAQTQSFARPGSQIDIKV